MAPRSSGHAYIAAPGDANAEGDGPANAAMEARRGARPRSSPSAANRNGDGEWRGLMPLRGLEPCFRVRVLYSTEAELGSASFRGGAGLGRKRVEEPDVLPDASVFRTASPPRER
jgi:hypothetical protein